MAVSWRWRDSRDEQLSVENQDRRGRGEKMRHWRVCLEWGVQLKKEADAEMRSLKISNWCHCSEEGETAVSAFGWLLDLWGFSNKIVLPCTGMICASNLGLLWPGFPKFGVKTSLIFQGFFLYLSLLSFSLCPRGELWRRLQSCSSAGFICMWDLQRKIWSSLSSNTTVILQPLIFCFCKSKIHSAFDCVWAFQG